MGAAKGMDICVYYTIGTGIGVGVYTEGKLVHGLVHPEGGHILTRCHPEDGFEGLCPYHGDCLEGMASGPAIENRWQHGREAKSLQIIRQGLYRPSYRSGGYNGIRG
jgi:fructokinase